MRKVFINIGAGMGSDIDGFLGLSPSHKDWEIFAFECNPTLVPIITAAYPKATVLQLAASTENTKTKLYLGDHYVKSSLLSSKVNVFKDKFITVETIDISKWLLDNFSKDDYIVLTLDIEGAEYEVLEKMIGDESLDMINELYVEFHGKKIKNLAMEYEQHLVDYLIKKFEDKVYIYQYYNHDQFIKLNSEAR